MLPCSQENEKLEKIRLLLILKMTCFLKMTATHKMTFKEFHDVLLDNYQLSVRRFNHLKILFNKDKMLLNKYYKIFNEYLKNDIIEKNNITEDYPGVGKVHYLPLHLVIKTDCNTTKIRIVFDASAHIKAKPCLNNILNLVPFSCVI